MLRRIEGDERREPPGWLGALGLARTEAVVPPVPEAELETALLPHDHPQWIKDALTVSTKARELLARLKPVAVRILSFWDHRVRSVAVGSMRVSVDPSGSYRAE